MSIDSKALRIALVAPEHTGLYQTSASFHSAIDTLVQMLPAWIDGLAAQVEPFEEQLRENFVRSVSGQQLQEVDLPDFLKLDEGSR